jgi:hypothetical protein
MPIPEYWLAKNFLSRLTSSKYFLNNNSRATTKALVLDDIPSVGWYLMAISLIKAGSFLTVKLHRRPGAGVSPKASSPRDSPDKDIH